MKAKRSISIPCVTNKTRDHGTREGFYLTSPPDVSPIITMDPELGIDTARKFWKFMGYQVSDIIRQPQETWLESCPSLDEAIKAFTGFCDEIDSLPSEVLDYFDRNYTCDNTDTITYSIGFDKEEEEVEYVNAEINKIFCKFLVSYSKLSDILFYDPKRINHIGKGVFEFLATRSEIEKISLFYIENKTMFQIKPATESDIAGYMSYNESLGATCEITCEG